MRFFHVSDNRNLDSSYIYPRVPESKMNNENETIPRICVSPSINGCLTATSRYKVGEVLYVYECKSKKFIQPDEDEVMDAPLTGECWVTEPVKMKFFTKIKIKQIVKSKIGELENNLFVFDVLVDK